VKHPIGDASKNGTYEPRSRMGHEDHQLCPAGVTEQLLAGFTKLDLRPDRNVFSNLGREGL
jgi:hypothetical protein